MTYFLFNLVNTFRYSEMEINYSKGKNVVRKKQVTCYSL